MIRFEHFSFALARRYSRPSFIKGGVASVLSLVSLMGIALAVFSLVLVMSVMNGFERELQSRMFALLPHIQLSLANTSGSSKNAALQQERLKSLFAQLEQHPQIVAAGAYVADRAVINQRGSLIAVDLLGIEPGDEFRFSNLQEKIVAGDLSGLHDRSYGVVIGAGLARQLGVYIGDAIDLTVPKVYTTLFGPTMRQKRFTVEAIFEVGSELDINQVMLHYGDARRFLGRSEEADGVRLTLVDPYRVGEVKDDITRQFVVGRDVDSTDAGLLLSGEIQDWQQSNTTLYAAVALEKTMMFVLLIAVVAVACFNIISIVLMTASNKQRDIAVLKTIGASRSAIRNTFILQGILVGSIGSVVGGSLGIIVAPSIGNIVARVEQWLGMTLFDPSVYYIPFLPSVLYLHDVAAVCSVAILISALVSVVPADRAAAIDPVQSLRDAI